MLEKKNLTYVILKKILILWNWNENWNETRT